MLKSLRPEHRIEEHFETQIMNRHWFGHSLLLGLLFVLALPVGHSQQFQARAQERRDWRDESPLSRKLYPVDESHLDPSFAEFKAKLLEAIEKRDQEFLRSALASNVTLSFEGPSTPEQAQAAFDYNNGGLWEALREALLLGATRFRYGFCAPYIFTLFPKNVPFDSLVIIGEDVEVRAEPYETAPVISHLSYDIVKTNRHFSLQDRIDGEKHYWHEVTTPDGLLGYVWGKYTRDVVDYRFCFDKLNGKWVLTSFFAGD